MNLCSFAVALLTGLFALLGVALGQRLMLKRTQKEVIFEKKLEHVAEFLAQAQINLKHVVSVKLKGEAIGQALGDAQELTRLGKRTAFYLSDESANAVEQFADDFFKGVYKLGQEQTVAEDYFTPLTKKLTDLQTLLRTEIVVPK